MSRNVTDVSKKLDIVVEFLGDMNSTLHSMDNKLNSILQDVSAMKEDLRRLTGKPVLEVLAEVTQELLDRSCKLRGEVYIPIDGRVKSLHEETFTTEPDSLQDMVLNGFLLNPKKQVLLLSGAAGSGKSTFVRELELLIETKYKELREKKREGVKVILIKVNLPTIVNPLSDLFHECLTKHYGLRDTQVHELRGLAKAGKVELVFLLDAYDELKQQMLFKNLYRGNNMEQYRSSGTNNAAADRSLSPRRSKRDLLPPSTGEAPLEGADAEDLCFPKVIITTRSELLSGVPNYTLSFLPLESENSGKDEVHEAETFFVEYRLAQFDDKLVQ